MAKTTFFLKTIKTLARFPPGGMFVFTKFVACGTHLTKVQFRDVKRSSFSVKLNFT